MHKYVIIPVKELTHEVLDSVHQTSFRTVRRDKKNRKAILSYSREQPECLRGYKELSHEEALAEMKRWETYRPWWKCFTRQK